MNVSINNMYKLNVSFNDIEGTPVEYIKSHVYDFKSANALAPFNYIACDNNAIGIITMLFSDNNNTTGQYRVIIRDDLLTCIQYITTLILLQCHYITT